MLKVSLIKNDVVLAPDNFRLFCICSLIGFVKLCYNAEAWSGVTIVGNGAVWYLKKSS